MHFGQNSANSVAKTFLSFVISIINFRQTSIMNKLVASHYLHAFLERRKISFVIGSLLMIILSSGCKSSSVNQPGELVIVDVRNSGEPNADNASHKDGDVEVYRISFMADGYKARFYRLENNRLQSHEGSYMTDDVFDKATYSWTSDTAVAIRLYNAATNKEKKFELYGSGSTSGLRH